MASSGMTRLKEDLAQALKAYAQGNKWDDAEASDKFGVSGDRLADIYEGRTDRYALESLIRMSTDVGLRITLSIKPDSKVRLGVETKPKPTAETDSKK